MKTTTKKPVFVISENNICPTIRLYKGMEVDFIVPKHADSNHHISYVLKGNSFGPGTYPGEKMRLKILFR